MNATMPITVFAAAMAFAGTQADAQETAADTLLKGWPVAIKAQHWPGAYWWCPGSALDQESIDWNLDQMHAAGIRNAHFIPIYGAKGYEDRYLQYLSPEWLEMLAYTAEKAAALGMNLDMSTGTGWCFGGPGLDKTNGDILVDYGARSGKLSFRSGRKVKRAAPGGEGPMVNPYSPSAWAFYLERFSEAFDQTPAARPRAQYHDSFEYAGDWTPELLDEFKARRGYDLADHLEVFFAEKGNVQTRARLKCDYRETLAELHLESIETWVDWAHERGMVTRNQAHGAPANLLDVYAAADIPETEMFGAPDYPVPGFRRDPALVRPGDSDRRICMFAASAAHVAHEPGKQLVSSESCTWLREHWHTSLGQAKLEIDEFFLAGVNHVFYHGTCYSPKDAPWPGWFFYASTRFDFRNAFWRDIPFLNAYIARCQSVLQAGAPDNDVLLYWPVYDVWSDPKGTAKQFTVHDNEWLAGQRVGDVAQALLDRGHAFDFISDRQMQTLAVQNSQIQAPGGAYDAVVVPACRHMPAATLRKLAELAEAGAELIFDKRLPMRVPGFAALEARQAELDAARDRLEQRGVVIASDVLSALDTAGIRREALVDGGLAFVRRKDGTNTSYFIVNHSARDFDGWLPLTEANMALQSDPMTGTIGSMVKRSAGNGALEVYLQLAAGASCILESDPAASPYVVRDYWEPAGEGVALTRPWTLDFIEGGPALPATQTMDALVSWTEGGDHDARAFAGTGRYKTTFTVPGNVQADDWLLDLGDVRESARVRVNGHDAGALIALPFQLRIGAHLKPGENTLEIEVTNLSANRIRALDASGADWRIMRDINIVTVNYEPLEPAQWPVAASGLLGPVRLVHQRRLNPSAQ